MLYNSDGLPVIFKKNNVKYEYENNLRKTLFGFQKAFFQKDIWKKGVSNNRVNTVLYQNKRIFKIFLYKRCLLTCIYCVYFLLWLFCLYWAVKLHAVLQGNPPGPTQSSSFAYLIPSQQWLYDFNIHLFTITATEGLECNSTQCLNTDVPEGNTLH